MEKKQIRCYANVKQVSVKNLVSLDKEVKIVLSIVGADIDQAILLSALPIETQVKIEAEL